MKSVKKLMLAVLTLALCVGLASAEHRVNKKKRMIVVVQQSGDCIHGISVSAESWGDRHFCADNPDEAASYLQPFIGSSVEVVAAWTFEGNPKTDAPVAVKKVFKVGREKVYDPCAVHKIGLIAGLLMVAGGGDPDAAASLAFDPNCGANANADNGGGEDQK